MEEILNTAWYRKYRPENMNDYMGESIKQVVEARFSRDENMPNVIMVYGDRGCGKTTFARIITKYYLCEHKVNGKPCEECESCRTINETLINGEAGVEVPGVTEVDATIANGKEAIQQIIEDALIPPMYTKKKILIMDEAHMITSSAQNSMLKIIEDIPPHLVVIFATTDQEKVLTTIKSRCQLKLEVKKKTVDEMADRLLYIATKEHLKTSKEALKIIAKKGDRVPRECINLLESVAKAYGNEVTIENIRAMTGEVASELYMNYFKSANTGLENILEFNQMMKEKNVQAKDFIKGLTRFVLDCMYIKHAIALEDYPPEYVEQVKKLFAIYTSSEFDVLLQAIEYASNMIGADETKNELIITTTAMRIGKIGLLANGLAKEINQAEKENKQSIREYKRSVEKEEKQQLDKVISFEPTANKLSSVFKGLTEVNGVGEVDLSGGLIEIEKEKQIGFDGGVANNTKEDSMKLGNNNSNEGFLTPEQLEEMMNE